MSQVQPLRIDDEIMKIVEIKSQDEHIPKSTALKQFLYAGVEEYLLKLCAKGRISIGKIAELMGNSIYDLQEIAKEKGISLGVAAEDYEESKKTAKLL